MRTENWKPKKLKNSTQQTANAALWVNGKSCNCKQIHAPTVLST